MHRYFQDDDSGELYIDIDMFDDLLILYCLAGPEIEGYTRSSDVARCFELGYFFSPEPGWVELTEAGIAARRKHRQEVPCCPTCHSRHFYRRWRHDESAGSLDVETYEYWCQQCGDTYEEHQYTATVRRAGPPYVSTGTCIRLGTHEERRERRKRQRCDENAGSETASIIDSLASLATGTADDQPPTPKRNPEKFKMVLCPSCGNYAVMIRDVGQGPEWYCTSCSTLYYHEVNEHGPYMGCEKTSPGLPGM